MTLRAFAFWFAIAVQFACLCATSADASTITVTNLLDDGSVGSLREAIVTANSASGSTIAFQSGLSGIITLKSDLPAITASTTISGPGESSLAVDGSAAFRPFLIDVSTGTVSIIDLTVQSGADYNGDGLGGGGICLKSGKLALEQLRAPAQCFNRWRRYCDQHR